MRIMVTGAEGFIGKHLCSALELIEHSIIKVDRIAERPLDLLVPGIIPSLLDEDRPDMVVHLAAQVGRIFGERDLTHTVSANATMTTLIAQACGTRGIPVLYSSSSEVYGDQGDAICTEDTPCVLPHNLYGLSKRWGEEALQLYAPDQLRIVRLSMPYGPGAPPGVGRRAMDTFMWQALHRKPIIVHAGAERSWCHVRDTVRGILMVMAAEPGIYNVGRSDRPVSMHALAQACCRRAGAPLSIIQEVNPPQAQTVVKRLGMEKLRGLGWRPTVELSEGVPEMLSWVRNFDEEGRWIGSA